MTLIKKEESMPSCGSDGAELVGYAALQADTFVSGPPSGAYDQTGKRSSPRFSAQPVQGFSSVQPLDGGAFIVLPDNGFGSKKNSPDFLLRIYTIRPDLRTVQGGTGTIKVDSAFIQLRDPDHKVNFLIVNENTSERLLTGADFDPESLVVARDGSFWVGEEFGPFLLHFDATGRLLTTQISVPDPRPRKDPAKDFIRSPDNPFLDSSPLGALQLANLGRSKGYESMTLSSDGLRLYLMLEGPLADDPTNRLLILAFDLASERFTDRFWLYQITVPDNSVRDIASVNANEFLVIEGDQGHGSKAKFKKVFLINLNQKDADGYVVKHEVVDLLNICDPNNLAGFGPKFTFPYLSIEGIAPLDSTTIVVINDNNYPSEGARHEGVRDSNEFIVLKLGRSLNIDPRLIIK